MFFGVNWELLIIFILIEVFNSFFKSKLAEFLLKKIENRTENSNKHWYKITDTKIQNCSNQCPAEK